MGVLESCGTGAGVGAAAVEHDGVDPAVAHDLLGPEHRCCLDPVGGEHPGARPAGSVVDEQRDVEQRRTTSARRRRRLPETERCGDASRRCGGLDGARHGATPSVVRPAVSSRAEGEVGVLHGLPRRALHRLSSARDDHGTAAVGVGRDLQRVRHCCRSSRRWSATGRRPARGRTARRRTPTAGPARSSARGHALDRAERLTSPGCRAASGRGSA